MKRLLSLLMITFAVASVQALTVNLQFPSSYTLTYEDNTTVTSGELLRVVFVTGGTLTDAASIPFTVDAAGQLELTTTDSVTASWATFNIDGDTTTSLDAIPLTDSGTVDASTIYAVTTTSSTPVYGYVVLFDSRTFTMADDGTISSTAGGTPVGSVAIAPIGSSTSTDTSAASTLSSIGPTYPIVRVGQGVTGYRSNLPGQSSITSAPTSAWQDVAEITSLTVGETTYNDTSSPTLEEYLTPAISAFSLDSSTGYLTITASSNDAVFYALETSDSLSGTWVSLEEFLINNGKTLDDSEKMYYSRFRLDGNGSTFTIPIVTIEGESSRFYRFSSGSTEQ